MFLIHLSQSSSEITSAFSRSLQITVWEQVFYTYEWRTVSKPIEIEQGMISFVSSVPIPFLPPYYLYLPQKYF
jgi:hypothetical protein